MYITRGARVGAGGSAAWPLRAEGGARGHAVILKPLTTGAGGGIRYRQSVIGKVCRLYGTRGLDDGMKIAAPQQRLHLLVVAYKHRLC